MFRVDHVRAFLPNNVPIYLHRQPKSTHISYQKSFRKYIVGFFYFSQMGNRRDEMLHYWATGDTPIMILQWLRKHNNSTNQSCAWLSQNSPWALCNSCFTVFPFGYKRTRQNTAWGYMITSYAKYSKYFPNHLGN